jgi:hypothetical protein
MASRTLHESQCVNRFLALEYKGNPLVSNQCRDVNCWVQGYLPIMKVGPGCMVGLQLHVTSRYTEGMADIPPNRIFVTVHRIYPPLGEGIDSDD